MKKLAIVAALAGLVAPLEAQIIDQSYSGINAAIPDGSLSGLANQQTISGGLGPITDINVTLNISGAGYGAVNGDIYAYLSHNGEIAVLLNRTGRQTGDPLGYTDNGFSSVTFDDGAANGDVHSYRLTLSGDPSTPIPTPGALTGIWAPDGRNVSPSLVLESSPRTAMLNVFNGMDSNGAWTLFLADVETGGTATLEGWSMQITAVPEPHETALIAGCALTAFAVWRRYREKQKVQALLKRVR